jgi:hypothetical protein
MKLRTRLDVFSAALLSALGASSVVGCGGTFTSDSGKGPNGGAGSPTGSAGTLGVAGNSNLAGGDNAGAGQGGSSAGGATYAAGNGGMPNSYPCKNPKDLGGGVIQCDDFIHRTESKTCASKLPRPEPYPNPPATAQCKQDADCTDKPNGWCGNAESGGGIPGPFCQYGCLNDSDCGAEQLCLCGDPVGRCVQATDCRTDLMCSPGYLCRSYDTSRGCGIINFACQTFKDECGGDAECAAKVPGSYCVPNPENFRYFQCQTGGCAIGRPFLVEGEQRLAPMSARADWRELALLPRLDELDAALSAHLAEQWTRVALMEHASIAAFARFSLQLLSLGAPPGLVELTTSAMADETRHAKACFAVASQYAGASVGPGRLAVESSLNEMSLEQIVRNTIREGCVGETVAAIEAREAAEHAADPALRALLLVISEDESRHAELAFRFVQWALAQGDAALECAVRREFESLCAFAPSHSELDAQHSVSLAHGIVPEPMRQVIRARAINDVILPCSRALYAPHVRRSAAAALDTSAP